jgi:hypothetical protein
MANLLHTKGTRTQIYKTLPSNSVGNDGDIILSQIQGKGVYLCSKVNGRWHVSNKMEELRKIEKTSIKDLKLDRVRVSNTTITKDEYDVSFGDFTLDVAGDIELNTDGGQVTIKDDTATHFLFDCDATRFRIYDDANANDFFTITIGAEGATTISTVDADTTAAHLTLDVDGDIILDTGADLGTDIYLKANGNTFGLLDGGTTSAKSRFFLYEAGGASTDDYLLIQTLANGATVLQTKDNDGANAHLQLNADGYTAITIDDGNDDDIRITNGGQISHSFYSESGAESIFKMYEAGGDSSTDFFQISTQANGATILSTTDAAATAAHLTLDPDGDLILSDCDVKMDGGQKFYFDGGSHTWIGEQSSDLLNFAVGGQNLMAIQEDATTSVAQSSKVYAACPVLLKDIGGVADTPISGYGSLYVNSDVLYFKTDGGTATNLLSGGGGTSRWHTELGGYKTNNTSTTTYYTFYRKWYDNWSNSDSSPTSINVYDSPSVAWIAPADCTVTNFRVVGYCNDTGATDPFKFYIYKGTTAHDATSTSLTLVANTDAISCAAALRAFNESKDISSGNSISAGEQLYVFLKKDSNTGNQDLYFNIVMSGEYS